MAETAALPTLANAAAFRPGTQRRLLALLGLAILSIALFMTVNLRGNLAFALELRAVRLAALVEVAIAISLSTVIFQTITSNRILTPSIMGLDALYELMQAVLVFAFGAHFYSTLPDALKFTGEAAAMALLAAALFLPLLKVRGDLTLMLLTGVVLGVLMRSLSSFVARLIDPNDYAVVQGAQYANFNTVNSALALTCLVAVMAGAALAWRGRHILDIMALGPRDAVALGVAWRGMAALFLLLVGVLVAISTALVGPVAFLGLLVVALAERVVGTRRQGPLMIGAALLAIILLVGGQTVLQHALGNALTLGIVIEFAGGLVFLALIMKGQR